MDWNKLFKMKNVSGGRLVSGSISLPNGDSKVINPILYSDKVINSLKVFYERDDIEVENIEEEVKEQKAKESNVRKVETLKNATGEKNEHVVYDPEVNTKKDGLIKVQEHNVGKSLEVKEHSENQGKAIETSGEIDKLEAKEFFDKHWKTVEKELDGIKSKKKLEFYAQVAKELGITGKKVELVEQRLKELEG